MKNVYLALAIVGGIVPLAVMFGGLSLGGPAPAAFGAAVFANPVSSAVAADLLFSSIVFWVFMFSRPAAPKPWLFIALNLVVGLSCALPAYLYADARSRAI